MRYIKGRWIPAPKRNKQIKLGRIAVICLLFFLPFAAFSEWGLSAVSEELTQTAAKKYVISAVNRAVKESLKDSRGEELSLITRDDAGNVVSVQANTYVLNNFKASLSERMQKELNGNARVGIPAGSFTGLRVLNGRGFDVPMRLNLEGNADISFESGFIGAGVNQTCHRITLKVVVSAVSQSASFGASTEYETNIVLSETVIVGTVPQWISGQINKE